MTLSYGYMSSAFVEMILTRWHHPKAETAPPQNVYAIRKNEEGNTNNG